MVALEPPVGKVDGAPVLHLVALPDAVAAKEAHARLRTMQGESDPPQNSPAVGNGLSWMPNCAAKSCS
jgi:hypothetical protein